MEKTLILTPKQVSQKIQRIAYEILEKNYAEDTIVLIGIANNGYKLALRIEAFLKQITSTKVVLLTLDMDKHHPLKREIRLSENLSFLDNKSVTLIDDVLNSGRTLIHATKFLLDADLKTLTTVVLIDRRHRKFPIKANFVGLTLSTTLQEHIEVEFENNEITAYLQ